MRRLTDGLVAAASLGKETDHMATMNIDSHAANLKVSLKSGDREMPFMAYFAEPFDEGGLTVLAGTHVGSITSYSGPLWSSDDQKWNTD